MRSGRFIAWVLGAGVAMTALACRPAQRPTSAAPAPAAAVVTTRPATPATTQSRFKALNLPELENAHVVTDKVLSGAQPEDAKAFETLARLGVKTIISVDGATPDVETARKYGIRYVHLPIKYDGVKPEDGRAIAKAIDELPGPIYLHCHHGKHRSAAAVAVACVYNGSLKPEDTDDVLKTFGTGANYKGLWKAAADARPLPPEELAKLQVNYVEKAKIDGFGQHMVSVDVHWEHVKQIQKAGWKSPPDHPDLDPAHEVLQLEEHLRESARLKEEAGRPAAFKKMLAESESSTRALRELLTAGNVDTQVADKLAKQIAQSCTDCHKAYRD